MPPKNPFLRIAMSAKVQTALLTWLGTLFTILQVAPESQAAWLALIAGGFGLAGVVIGAWAYEDGQEKAAAATAAAQQPTAPAAPPAPVAARGPAAFKPGQLLTVLMLVSVPLFAGCATSEGYKRTVSKFYPVIAARMESHELTDEQSAEVQRLREVAADKRSIRYDDARDAWDDVAPDYREIIAGDDALPGNRRVNWLATADKLDETQAAELKYRQTLGLSPQP